MCGSWSGGVHFLDGSPFDTAGGYSGTRGRSHPLAVSWMVPESESLIDAPTDVCSALSTCGGVGDDFACEATRRDLQEEECDRTCGDIEIPEYRESCEIDVDLTNEAVWACEPNYVNPVITVEDPVSRRFVLSEACIIVAVALV